MYRFWSVFLDNPIGLLNEVPGFQACNDKLRSPLNPHTSMRVEYITMPNCRAGKVVYGAFATQLKHPLGHYNLFLGSCLAVIRTRMLKALQRNVEMCVWGKPHTTVHSFVLRTWIFQCRKPTYTALYISTGHMRQHDANMNRSVINGGTKE